LKNAAGDASKGASHPVGSLRGAGAASVRAWVRLLEVHKAALAELRDELQGDVTLPRFDLLANLDREDGQTLASLSRKMLVTAGNLTGLVDRAERDGLVERRADARDRRATRVFLTKRGRKLYADAVDRHARRLESIFRSLGPHERDALGELLGKVRSDLRTRKEHGR
jgi:DNA-binding MarR family transcriptional regulator